MLCALGRGQCLFDYRNRTSAMPKQSHVAALRIEDTNLVVPQLEQDLVGGQIDSIAHEPGAKRRFI